MLLVHLVRQLQVHVRANRVANEHQRRVAVTQIQSTPQRDRMAVRRALFGVPAVEKRIDKWPLVRQLLVERKRAATSVASFDIDFC